MDLSSDQFSTMSSEPASAIYSSDMPHSYPSEEAEHYITNPELRNLDAGDFPGLKVHQLGASEYPYRNYDWQRLHSDLDQHGMKTPLTVVHRRLRSNSGNHALQTPSGAPQLDPQGTLVNGHHRAVAALDRGMMFIPTTTEWGGEHGNYRNTRAVTHLLNSEQHPWLKFHPEADYQNMPQNRPAQHRGQGTLF